MVMKLHGTMSNSKKKNTVLVLIKADTVTAPGAVMWGSHVLTQGAMLRGVVTPYLQGWGSNLNLCVCHVLPCSSS